MNAAILSCFNFATKLVQCLMHVERKYLQTVRPHCCYVLCVQARPECYREELYARFALRLLLEP